MVDGDDGLAILERKDHARIDFHKRYDKTGFVVTWRVVDHISEVEFCSSKLIYTSDGPKFVSMPWRTLSNTTVGSRPRPDTYWLGRMRADAIGLYSVMKGVPILQEYALAWINATNGFKPINLTGEAEWHKFRLHDDYKQRCSSKWINVKSLRMPILADTRTQYEIAYDISPGDQCLIETQCWSAFNDYVKRLDSRILESFKGTVHNLQRAW